jgi:hypothetical protein
MIFSKPPFPVSKPVSPDEIGIPPSYTTPSTTPAQNIVAPLPGPVASTSTAPQTVDLEAIFEQVHREQIEANTQPDPNASGSTHEVIYIDSDTEGEDEATDIVIDLAHIAEDFVSHHLPNTLPARLQRDRQMQEHRLKQLDPEVLTAAMWGSFKTISAILNDNADERDEGSFRVTCHQLLPLFAALSKKMKSHGQCQIIHIPANMEHVDYEADFVVLDGRDYLIRQQRIKKKGKAMSLLKLHGYSQPDEMEQTDLLMAHNIHSSIRLTIGGGTSVPAPFPAHVLRDVPAVQRFTEIALPGTVFLDSIPTEVEKTRILFGVCKTCASIRERCDCRGGKVEERRSFTPTYVYKLVAGVNHYLPPSLVDDFDVHVTHYELVYPGACFLFGKVPPAIEDARANFRLCPDCGLSHKVSLNSPPFTMLPTPAALLCPYNARLLAERFVREFHQFESYSARPAIPYSSGRLYSRD